MTLVLAFLTGMGLGYIVERGDLCFHSTLRGLFRRPARLDLFRAYLLALPVAAPHVLFFYCGSSIRPARTAASTA
ncbi:MAG: hypothetical protein ACE5LU_12275 [Anaerolineae bacterium]